MIGPGQRRIPYASASPTLHGILPSRAQTLRSVIAVHSMHGRAIHPTEKPLGL